MTIFLAFLAGAAVGALATAIGALIWGATAAHDFDAWI